MAADVSSLIRMMNGSDAKESAKSTAPITRDLLGGSCTVDSKELDLDLQVPCGWEKRLDLKSGRVYIQRCNTPAASDQNPKSRFQDLNFPPTISSKPTLTLFDDASLELKLVSPSPSSAAASSPPSSCNYQSVCTLDKVKSALERAEKETVQRKRSISSMSLSKSSSPRSTSSSSIRDNDIYSPEDNQPASFAAGCPSCLLYVLISKNNPRCPRCNSDVPLPVDATKKPKIDLNISI